MEKLIRSEIIRHVRKNKLFSKQQYGFIDKRSTTLQLLKIIDDWNLAVEQGYEINAVYLDFMKAFDQVPHRRLIHKIKSYGIEEQTVNWIENFLNNRKQKVIVNGAQSEWNNVTSGIPQGSVLGLILFVLYINDLQEGMKSEIFLFADDTKVYSKIKKLADRKKLQRDLDRLQT